MLWSYCISHRDTAKTGQLLLKVASHPGGLERYTKFRGICKIETSEKTNKQTNEKLLLPTFSKPRNDKVNTAFPTGFYHASARKKKKNLFTRNWEMCAFSVIFNFFDREH